MIGLDPRALRVAWTVFLFALAVAFVYAIRGALIVFTLALFLALLLSPLVTLVNRFTPAKFPRGASLAVVYVLLIGITAAILIPIGSAIADDARALASRLPEAIQNGAQGSPFAGLPLPAWVEPVRERIAATLTQRLDEIAKDALPVIGRAAAGVLTGLGALVSAVLIPILAFFFIKDGEGLRDGIVNSTAETRRGLVAGIFSDLRQVLAQYLRALLIIAAVTFVVFSAFLSLTGGPYAVLLAGFAGLLEFIPAVGPFIAAVSIIVVGLFSGYQHWALLIVFLIVYRIALDYGLQPVLMGKGIQLHPLLIVFGALAGGEIAGIPGIFFSVPLMAALRVIVLRLTRQPVSSA